MWVIWLASAVTLPPDPDLRTDSARRAEPEETAAQAFGPGGSTAVVVEPSGQISAMLDASQSDDDWSDHAVRRPGKAEPVSFMTEAHGKHQVRILHILSMGSVGSSFFADRLCAATPCAIEPLEGIIEHGQTIHDGHEVERLGCLYGISDCQGVITSAKADDLRQVWHDAARHSAPIGIKTTRIHDFTKIADVIKANPALRGTVKYVVMFRDPRAVWATTKLQSGTLDYMCAALREELDSLPALIDAAGRLQVLTAIYESWSPNMSDFLVKLSSFWGFPKEPQDWKLYATTKDSTTRWTNDISLSDIRDVENNADCAHYMRSAGYDTYEPGHVPDYSSLLPEAAVWQKDADWDGTTTPEPW